ncbi:hypothetical protein QJS04_geneDACA004020 [Acorus gramineus]|uniref:Uncharacterized protein n=1 Tax=Acorus gramineus TaxID=55184 RepID=A0AAV9BG98_ACOGR|nr:hypothetical protein QJS04_geneDACA004020 [Acorus gramineus]
MTSSKCRIWWPKNLSSSSLDPSQPSILFGWFIGPLDVVVAFSVHSSKLHLFSSQADLQEIVHRANGEMPFSLQDRSTFSILGQHVVSYSNGSLETMAGQSDDDTSGNSDGKFLYPGTEKHGNWDCGCETLCGILEPCRQSCIGNTGWIQLTSVTLQGLSHSDAFWIPKLHHVHHRGRILQVRDVHLILYDLPTYGVHHYSLSSWGSSDRPELFSRRPNWFDELQQKQSLPNMEVVIMALNSASIAVLFFKRHRGLKYSAHQLLNISMLMGFARRSVAIFVATISTLFYIVLQLCHRILSYGLLSSFYSMLAKLFRHTWKNLHIRSCQLLYWPILLQGSGLRSKGSVGFAHRSTRHRHSIWSSIVVDILLGNIMGLALLVHAEAVLFWISAFAYNVTDNLLRSGCVWLMGDPAGFKLNTELARVLGMISLTAIQIWSTLWFCFGFLFPYFIKGLAILGIAFGLTLPAALCIDMLKISTLHLDILHRLISCLYSQQIQALASLWRLFRGRKWNPLRQRFDSYDYTVKQHVVGSLLFTPLLLLVPTTSVFYIFFTNIVASFSCFSILIELAISILHATPYAEIFLWMVRHRTFPSGIWFDIFAGQQCKYEVYKTNTNVLMNRGPEIMVSVLQSNFATIGQIVSPHYRRLFSGVSLSSGASSAYGVLSGQRIPSSLHTSLPSTMPWISIGYRDYWRLCRDSILSHCSS